MATSNSFLFLPDISGFTDFVNQTEIDHSGHIIRELLELLIDSEELGLSLAEIEGDALFFYSFEKVPSPEALFKQAKKMYQLFHTHLLKYQHERVCQCGACISAGGLDLKFIAHAGVLDFIQIKDQRKPFGKEVISAHRLMKNDVPSDGYLLLSEGLFSSWSNEWSSPKELTQKNSSSTYDFGAVNYHFFTLDPWRQNLSLPKREFPGIRLKNPVQIQIPIKASPESVFEIVSNLEYRLLINPGLTDIQFERNKINRAGMEHLCVIDENQIVIETIPTTHTPEVWEFGERIVSHPFPFLKEMTNYFLIEKIEENNSLLTAEVHAQLPWFLSWAVKPFMERVFKQGLTSIVNNVRDIAEADRVIETGV